MLLLYPHLMMLSQNEFSALLRRYVAGVGTAADQHLLDQWLAQLVTPSQPDLTAEELLQVRLAIWQRLEEATKET